MSEVKYKICSRCGAQMEIEEGVICTSIPPMYRYKCPKCGAMEFDVERYPMPEVVNNLTAQPTEATFWCKFRAEAAKDILCAFASNEHIELSKDNIEKSVESSIALADILIIKLKEDGKE